MRAFLIAGEASGDKLGAALMAGLKTQRPEIQFSGIGGPLMQAQGLNSLFPMDELSVMGIAEILPKYRQLMARINQTAAQVLDEQPDVLITIDSPDFCLRVARRVKAQSDIRTVHYVAPTVWAWRAGRAQKMARVIDHVLALFPFEPPYMQAAGMACDFVGHPVVAEPTASADDIAELRARYDLGSDPCLLVLPGSRRGEVTRLAPIFGRAIAPLLTRHPEMRVIVPATHVTAPLLQELVADWPCKPIILDPRDCSLEQSQREKRAGFAAAELALAASGTVSLELAAAGTPMVIAYDMSWLSRQIISRMLRVDTVTLVNLVSETRTIPEFIGANCQPDAIGAALLDILHDPSQQQNAMSVTMQRLGQGGDAPGLRAAIAVLTRLDAAK